MIRLTLFVFCFTLLKCSTPNNKKNPTINVRTEDSVSKIIDSMRLTAEYNEAKWFVYKNVYDDTLKFNLQFKESEKEVYTFGELQLNAECVQIDGDTVDVKFCFSLKGKYDCNDYFVGNKCVISNVGIKKATNSLLYFWNSCNFKIVIDSVFKKRLQERNKSLASYIQSNFEKISPWFREEALRRKIIPKM